MSSISTSAHVPSHGLAASHRRPRSLASLCWTRARLLGLASCLLAACGGDDDGGPAPEDVVGTIEIEEGELGGIGAVASIYVAFEAPGEADLVDDGTCRIYPFPCLGQVGACGSPPQFSAGTITLGGLRRAVTLVPNAASFYPSPAGLPADLFADDAAITVSAAGDQVPAFSLAAGGVTPMVSSYVDASLGLVPGQPLALTWTAGGGDARVRLKVNWSSICHAGGEWYVLECDTADTGAFTVPASITAVLPSRAGFGQCGARLSRVRTATVPGKDLSLVVASSDYFGFF